ncbi:hypothetical protein AAFC00_005826 [Neodothiora populina]|uniref:Phosphoribosylaminoimidazole-succinocarboxamide synthase n=1 Tax=Neodothiora populina TaxID=2781224 RepID=A0ABR3P7B1_9PEZI
MAALGDSLHLKHTNVSQPSIQRTTSQQSLAASEDFYSLSSRSGSSTASGERRVHPTPRSPPRPHIERFLTAPSRRPSPPRVSYEGIATPVEVRQVELPRITPMRGIGRRRRDESEIGSSATIRRKPVPSIVYEDSPRSSIRYSAVPVESSAMKQAAYAPQPPSPETSDAPYIRFALDQITNGPNERGERIPLNQSYEDKPDLGPFMFEKNSPLRSHPVNRRDTTSPPIPPRSPRRSVTHSPDNSTSSPLPSLLMPFDPATDSFHQPLTALPRILRPLGLSLFISLLTAYLICLLFCAIWSRVKTGLSEYGQLGDGRYFLWQYLPTMLGMALLLWLFEIECAVYRVAPFIALSSKTSVTRSHGVFLPLSPSNFLMPSFTHVKAGQPAVTLFLFASWLSLLTIPLLGSSFNVYFQDGRWVWLATQGVIWTVIVLYILLLVASVVLFFYLHRRQTGLKWDACSLADLITIIQASNTLDSYAYYPLVTAKDEVRETISARDDMLGYFHSSLRPNEVVHTLGAPNRPSRRVGGENVRRSERYSTTYDDAEGGRPFSEYSTGTYNTTDPVLPQDMAESWQSHILWFLRTPLVALWLILAVVLLLAFLIVSYLPQTRVSAGFNPQLSVVQGNFGFSATNFLYSFIPSLLGLLCLLVWQPFDLAFRRLQPYAALSTPGGEVAEKSLLLSYNADAPILVTLQATVNKHFRVAAISLTTLIAAILPVLAGGVFWSQFSVSQQRVNVYSHMSAYYALTVFFVLYCLAYALVFPGKLRRLPNNGRCLADLIAFVHQSKILDDPEFHAPGSKVALVTRLLSARSGNRVSIHDQEKRAAAGAIGAAPPAATASKASIADSLRGIAQARRDAQAETRLSGGSMGPLVQPQYGFGRYIGRDGREWLGIDKIGRPGRGGEMVVRD